MALAEFAALGPKAKPAVPKIVAALNDSKSSIRVQAAAALIYFNFENEAAFRTLKAEMKGKDADERSNEAWELICTRPN